MVWTDESIERALRQASPDGARFPTKRELRSGVGGVYDHLRRRGELDVWANRLALERPRARWTDADIEQALRRLSADLRRFPTAKQFRDAGLEGLYHVLHKRGELDSWAQRLGLERRRRWNDATIAAALGELSAGQSRFPNVEQFRAAGLSGLYSALERRGELDAWAQRLGLPRHQVGDPLRWTDAAIRDALEALCAGRERWPTGREFREAGLYGLYAALRRRRELDVRAQRLALSRRSHKHPNKHRGRPAARPRWVVDPAGASVAPGRSGVGDRERHAQPDAGVGLG